MNKKDKLEDEVRELNEKRETVAQMEAQINEIIQWYVFSYVLCMCALI